MSRWWNLPPVQRVLAVVLAVVLFTGTVVGFKLLGAAIMGGKPTVASPSARPSAFPTPRPSAEAQAPPEAIQAARAFTVAYLDYVWSQPPDPHDLRGLTTDRLYGTLVNDGTTPSGLPAPWTKTRPDLHEVDSVEILGTSSQLAGNSQAAVQFTVLEHSRTDAGNSDTRKEIDLALEQRSQAVWLVDWVSERRAS